MLAAPQSHHELIPDIADLTEDRATAAPIAYDTNRGKCTPLRAALRWLDIIGALAMHRLHGWTLFRPFAFW